MSEPATRQRDTEGRIYFPVSPLMLFPESRAEFRVYLRQGENYVLYTKEKELFQDKHRSRLHDLGVNQVYVRAEQKDNYERYLEDNLGRILEDEDIPREERSSVLYDASVNIVKDVFDNKLPGQLSKKLYDKIYNMVSLATKFLTVDSSLKSMARMINSNYKTFSHCVHVFVYASAIFQTYDFSEQERTRFGVGAILHDMGKSRIHKNILEKKGKLTPEEWAEVRMHPVHGVAMCSTLTLPQDAYNCILLHHERMDGGGYPSGLTGDDIPLPVRIVSVCDVYDALTSERSYANLVTPFEALSIMRDKMKGAFDKDVYKRLVLVLSGAEII